MSFIVNVHPIINGNIELLRVMKDEGQDIPKLNICGRYPIHFAVEMKNQEYIKFLVDECGSSLDLKDCQGRTANDILKYQRENIL